MKNPNSTDSKQYFEYIKASNSLCSSDHLLQPIIKEIKMKLAVIFLATFAVGSLSQYHQFQKQPWMSPYHPARSYNPFLNYYFSNYDEMDEDDFNPTFLQSDSFSDVESRGGAMRHFRPFIQPLSHVNPQLALAADQRFFGLLNGGGGITISSSSKLPGLSGILKTKTVASLSTTTFTSISTFFCISSSQLLATTQCAAGVGRRRREIALINDMVEEVKRKYQENERFLRSAIAPHPVDKLAKSEIPSLDYTGDENYRYSRQLTYANPELESSQFNDDDIASDFKRNKRFFKFFQLTEKVSITNCTTTILNSTVPLNLIGSTLAIGSICIPSYDAALAASAVVKSAAAAAAATAATVKSGNPADPSVAASDVAAAAIGADVAAAGNAASAAAATVLPGDNPALAATAVANAASAAVVDPASVIAAAPPICQSTVGPVAIVSLSCLPSGIVVC